MKVKRAEAQVEFVNARQSGFLRRKKKSYARFVSYKERENTFFMPTHTHTHMSRLMRNIIYWIRYYDKIHI